VRYLLAFALALVPLALEAQDTLTDAYSAEDAKVLTAVIDHSIRPQVQKVTGLGSSAGLFIINCAPPACDRFMFPRSRPLCMPGIAEGQPTGFAVNTDFYAFVLADVVPSRAHRAELVASIAQRNTVRHTLPVSEGGDVKFVHAPPVMETPAGQSPVAYTVFSLPGYSSEGHPVVSAFFDCVGPCGGVMVWLLKKRSADWHVRGRDGWLAYGTGPVDAAFMRATKFDLPK